MCGAGQGGHEPSGADLPPEEVVSCRRADFIEVALVAMKENGLRRIPVVDPHTRVSGLVSIDDVLRHTGTGAGAVAAEAVLDVLRHICEHAAPATPL